MFQILSLCLVALIFSSVNAVDDERIVGGYIVNIKQVPYIVQLKSNGWAFCGGSLIAPTFVVTAAHCVDPKNFKGLKVVGNANARSDSGISRSVIAVRIAPGYSPKNAYNQDIAVLKLDKPLVGGVIKTVQLCTKPWQANQKLEVSGWGLLTDGGKVSEQLRTVSLDTTSHSECLTSYRASAATSTSKECAKGKGKDACQGDSGGPALIAGELCGVVSSGYGCADARYPGIYTSVYTMRDFINKAMKEM